MKQEANIWTINATTAIYIVLNNDVAIGMYGHCPVKNSKRCLVTSDAQRWQVVDVLGLYKCKHSNTFLAPTCNNDL